LNAVLLEWMERLQKCVQVDGKYVGWAQRAQYIEIDFNREIRLWYTWHEIPYTSPHWKVRKQLSASSSGSSIWWSRPWFPTICGALLDRLDFDMVSTQSVCPALRGGCTSTKSGVHFTLANWLFPGETTREKKKYTIWMG
jgi:hypothetical protein